MAYCDVMISSAVIMQDKRAARICEGFCTALKDKEAKSFARDLYRLIWDLIGS